MSDAKPATTTRRQILAGASALVGGLGVPVALPRPAQAQPRSNPAQMAMAIRKVVGEANVRKGKVKLDVPPLVENGNSVPLSVEVESPMTAKDHVKTVHVFTELNPQPYVITVQIGPRAGRAKFATRFRLADTQTIVAIAELSDGSFWSASADVVVTLAACLESL